MTRPPATVSVDVDPVDLHLVGYGYPDLPADPLVYDAALPRLLEAFARHGVRATLFAVGRDAAGRAPALRRSVEAGHEIASHSFTHPLALASLEGAAFEREVAGSKRALEAACGTEVVGFRSPNFDMNDRTLARLAAAGYRYDASAYPTPFMLPARVLLALKSRDPFGVLRLRPWPFTWRRLPHRRGVGEAALAEFPVTVTRGVRFPVYHTLRYGMSDARFESLVAGFARRAEPLSYILHAVDLLGLAEDHVDPRLAGHPGMGQPLDRKLALLERTLAILSRHFAFAPFRERLSAL